MTGNPFFKPSDTVLLEQLETYVSWLPYPALERLIVCLMRSLNYTDVSVVDGGKQRGRTTRYSGLSMMARHRGPVHDTLTIVQVKQITITRTHVDALRGAMLCEGASHGIIVTTGRIADKAQLRADSKVRCPVELVSRSQLAKFLIANRLGVRDEPVPPGEPWKVVIDELFFELLTEIKP